ncbi:MAG: phosphoglycerate mutase family protein, partial [Verrucomicrobia bacterium]|nr:phosphoglycerate mutase family protein [Verrucomicrobiota bacterium]
TFEEGQVAVQIGARTDLPLTAAGLVQAENMGRYLLAKGIAPQAIFAGGLRRQTESASVIGAMLGLPWQSAPALTEIDYGLWEGLPAEEIERKWPQEYAEWTREAKWQSHIFQGAHENHRKSLQRWVDELQTRYPRTTILGVTSNGLLRFFRNEKVKTGHFCELELHSNRVNVLLWNQNPSI